MGKTWPSWSWSVTEKDNIRWRSVLEHHAQFQHFTVVWPKIRSYHNLDTKEKCYRCQPSIFLLWCRRTNLLPHLCDWLTLGENFHVLGSASLHVACTVWILLKICKKQKSELLWEFLSNCNYEIPVYIPSISCILA